jgi:predicted phage terminase large subunit-like protein
MISLQELSGIKQTLKSLNKEQLTELKPRLAENSPEIFVAHWLKDSLPLDIPQFHEDIYSMAADRSMKRVCIIAPTGFGKSSVVSLAIPVWAACYAHYQEILIVSATSEFANYRLRLIKNEMVNNDMIVNDFGIGTSDIWRENEIVLNNGVRIVARGRGAQVTGMRPDLIIVDDIETEEQAKSEVERASLNEWFYKTLMNRPAPEGRIFMIGSISSRLAFLTSFVTEEARSVWNTRIYKTNQCNSIWQAKWSDDELRKKKVELAPYAGIYEALYEADVSQIAKYTFKKDWLRFYDTLPEGLTKYTVVDPAVGEGVHNDYTAIVTVGVDQIGNTYILDVIKKRFNVEALDLFSALFMVYDVYRPVKIGIESIGFQKFIKVFFEQECRKRGKYPDIVEIKHESMKTKQARISSLAAMFQAGTIRLRRDMYDLLSEYEAYPEVEHDDVLDALSMVKDLAVPMAHSANRGRVPVYRVANAAINF